jgi:hypothetical protein
VVCFVIVSVSDYIGDRTKAHGTIPHRQKRAVIEAHGTKARKDNSAHGQIRTWTNTHADNCAQGQIRTRTNTHMYKCAYSQYYQVIHS